MDVLKKLFKTILYENCCREEELLQYLLFFSVQLAVLKILEVI